MLFRLVLTLLIATPAFAKPSVNILSWWDYISDEKVMNYVESKCGVEVSLDEFYSNGEFSRRVRKSNYDVILHSEAAYSSILDLVEKSNSKFAKSKVEQYHPLIKRFEDSNFSLNSAYFVMYMTALVWDDKVIHLSENDSVEDILYKAQGKFVALADDQYEISHIFKNLTNSKDWDIPDSSSVSRYFYRTKFVATNLISNLVKHEDFALAYTWSGTALGAIKNNPNKNLKIMIHPKLSHASADMITALNNKKSTECVASLLSSKEIIEHLQTDVYYFSPYGRTKNKDVSPNFSYVENEFFKRLKKSSWLPDFTPEKAPNTKP